MPAPTMTPEQRQAALDKAREVRSKRSELTKKIQMDVKKPVDVLKHVDDPIVGRMKVKTFINAVPGYGKVKAEKLMDELGIQESRRLQGLGSRQMEGLKNALK
ncbi:MAG: integration host factor, actinobacterial type [Phoenicibacter congonensis]|uniref:Integration host factor, actinobacterial type n=1 Tax=Phoenicibacter congonensis TaxID=1944646 RepID=A0AA43U9P0_9ACTN|nr:integration host factor, actinobacterial type [Phoenicibacter congonensis]